MPAKCRKGPISWQRHHKTTTTEGDKEAPNQEEEYQCQRQAHILAREAVVRQQQEELFNLTQKIDRAYEDVEWRRPKAERPWTRNVHDLLAESNDGVQYLVLGRTWPQQP